LKIGRELFGARLQVGTTPVSRTGRSRGAAHSGENGNVSSCTVHHSIRGARKPAKFQGKRIANGCGVIVLHKRGIVNSEGHREHRAAALSFRKGSVTKFKNPFCLPTGRRDNLVEV